MVTYSNVSIAYNKVRIIIYNVFLVDCMFVYSVFFPPLKICSYIEEVYEPETCFLALKMDRDRIKLLKVGGATTGCLLFAPFK